MSEGSQNPRQLSPLVLAFVGDAVYGLLVRERLVLKANTAVNKLHNQSVCFVNAVSQAAAVDQILPDLSEDRRAYALSFVSGVRKHHRRLRTLQPRVTSLRGNCRAVVTRTS